MNLFGPQCLDMSKRDGDSCVLGPLSGLKATVPTRCSVQGSPVVQPLRTRRQSRGSGFDPCSGKTPHALGQLSPFTANLSPRTLGPVLRRGKPPQGEALTPQPENTLRQQQGPAQPKEKKTLCRASARRQTVAVAVTQAWICRLVKRF